MNSPHLPSPIIDLPESTTRSSIPLSPQSSSHLKPTKSTHSHRISFKITKNHHHSRTSLHSESSPFLFPQPVKHSPASISPKREQLTTQEPFDTQSSPIIKPKAVYKTFTFSNSPQKRSSKQMTFLLDSSFSPMIPSPKTHKPNNNSVSTTIFNHLTVKPKDAKHRKKTSLLDSFVRETGKSQKERKASNEAMDKISAILLRCKKLNKEVQEVEKRMGKSQDKYERSVEKIQKDAERPMKFEFWRTDKNFLIQRREVKENLKKFWDESKERSKSPRDVAEKNTRKLLGSLQAIDNEHNKFQATLPSEPDEEYGRSMKIGSITINEPRPQPKPRRIGSSILQDRFEKYAEYTRNSIAILNETGTPAVDINNTKISQKIATLGESTYVGNNSSLSMSKQEGNMTLGQPGKKKKIVMKILNKYLHTPQTANNKGSVNYSGTGRSSFFADNSEVIEERGNSLQRANRRIERKQTKLLQLMTGEGSLEELEQDFSMFKGSKSKHKKRSTVVFAPSIFISNASVGNL